MMQNDTAFLEAYGRLNEAQRAAVDTIEGPVMVVAGPGTGKTQILTLRIANILRKTDTAPESILALTFTKSGATAMRERLGRFIGVEAYRVPIFTFHGLAEYLIREYPEAYETIVGSKPATDIEKITAVETILTSPALVLLRPHGDPSFYIKPLLSIMSTMKQENVRPHDLRQIIEREEVLLSEVPRFHEKGAHKGKERGEYTKAVARLEKMRALCLVYQQYEAYLRSEKRYDFDDMIIETVAVLRNREDIRLDLQERFQYVLADEHQDVNGAQNEILSLLTAFHNHPNIFVVGDEKQAIYRFQGASLENFLYFVEQNAGTTLIALTENYRSTQAILDAGHALVAVPEESPLSPYRVPLLSQSSTGVSPAVSLYPHEGYEDEAVVDRVMAAIAAGVPLPEIAVIVRSNKEVESLTTLLRRAGVTVKPSADTDVLEHPLFAAVLDLMDVMVRPYDTAVLSRVVAAPYWQVPLADLALLFGAVSYKTPLSAVLAAPPEGVVDREAVLRVQETLVALRSVVLSEAPHRFLSRLCTETGLLAYAATADPLGMTHVIRRLYDEVEALVVGGEVTTLEGVVTLFRRRVAYGVPLNAPLLGDGVAAVEVMTAHKSKGLEFRVVVIPHVNEAIWGASKRLDYFKVPLMRTASREYEALEDERRLLYVAMTRAKESLYLSYAATNREGKELLPSPLLAVLAEPTPVPSAALREPALTLAHTRTDIKRVLVPIIEKTLRERGFSATSLNNCIKNPWHFLYRNVIRLPEVQSPSQQFGTAMHSVLEAATRARTGSGVLPSFTELRSRLESALGYQPLSQVEFTNLFARGQEVLAIYREHLVATLPVATKEELKLRVQVPLVGGRLESILLTGMLDRIDLDATGHALRVVDYKTGKPKTRNEIEGNTAKADASYRRQLTFYALLLAEHGDERYRTTEGVLSFIEPDPKGRIHDEVYTSDSDEQTALRTLIATAVETLLDGHFLNDEALLAASEYAAFGQQLLARF